MIESIQLPYKFNDLEPYYGTETLRIHYEILYKNYVKEYNKIQMELENVRRTNNYENIKCLEKNLSFNGSGVILHELFFENMISIKENVKMKVSLKLKNQIAKDFGSMDIFMIQFIEAARTVEASGWCLLVWSERFKKLEVLQCEKHQNLTLWGCIPILVLDTWEHSYFLQYKTNKILYINNFWKIINWNKVNDRFEKIGCKI